MNRSCSSCRKPSFSSNGRLSETLNTGTGDAFTQSMTRCSARSVAILRLCGSKPGSSSEKKHCAPAPSDATPISAAGAPSTSTTVARTVFGIDPPKNGGMSRAVA
jgi:hypothetical protein